MVDSLVSLVILIVIVGVVVWFVLWGLAQLPLGAFAAPARVLVIVIGILIVATQALPLIGVNV